MLAEQSRRVDIEPNFINRGWGRYGSTVDLNLGKFGQDAFNVIIECKSADLKMNPLTIDKFIAKSFKEINLQINALNDQSSQLDGKLKIIYSDVDGNRYEQFFLIINDGIKPQIPFLLPNAST